MSDSLLVEWGIVCASCLHSFTRYAAPSKADASLCWVCAGRREFADDAEFGKRIVLHDPVMLPHLRYCAALRWYQHHNGVIGEALFAWIARQECRNLVRIMRRSAMVRMAIRHSVSRRAVANAMANIAREVWDGVVREEQRIDELARRDGWRGEHPTVDALARSAAFQCGGPSRNEGYLAKWMRLTAPMLKPYISDMERALGFAMP